MDIKGIDLFLQFTKFVSVCTFPEYWVVSSLLQIVMVIAHLPKIHLSAIIASPKLLPPAVNSILQFSMVFSMNLMTSSEIL